ncbi:hypothetical protein RYX36_000600 [Vicia faba]
MSVRQRRSDKQSAEAENNSVNGADAALAAALPSLSRRALSGTLKGAANLANMFPSGTLLVFQILIKVFTNYGVCNSVTRLTTLVLLFLFALYCFLACFTDTVKASDGKIYHGIATFKGLWLFDYSPVVDTSTATLPDLTKYKLSMIDFVHAFLSVHVFFAVALRNDNVLTCYYPKPGHETKEVLDIVPFGIGFICSLLFLVFPTTRRGIGYPLTP